MATQFEWQDSAGTWIVRIDDSGNWNFNDSYCVNNASILWDFEDVDDVTITDKRFDYFYGSTRIFSIIWGSAWTGDLGSWHCPAAITEGSVNGPNSIATLNGLSNKAFEWQDSSGDPLAVLQTDGDLHIRGTFSNNTNCSPNTTVSNTTCKT